MCGGGQRQGGDIERERIERIEEKGRADKEESQTEREREKYSPPLV